MILLAGGNTALLEGLAQAFANTGQGVVVVNSLDEAMELQDLQPPILTVAERGLLADPESGTSLLHGMMAGGGALVTYREAEDTSRALPAVLARHVLADLVLPLERNRLVALADHLVTRARVVGRQPDVTRPGSPAS